MSSQYRTNVDLGDVLAVLDKAQLDGLLDVGVAELHRQTEIPKATLKLWRHRTDRPAEVQVRNADRLAVALKYKSWGRLALELAGESS